MNTVDIAYIAEKCGIEGAPAKVTWSTLNRFAEEVLEFTKNENIDKLSQQISDYLQLQYQDVIFNFCIRIGATKDIDRSLLFIADGMPDIEQYDGLCRGLFIELKADGKSPYLKDGKTLRKDNHIEEQAVFATGFDEAKKIIDDYLR